jgi:Fe-S-cluster containining protein
MVGRNDACPCGSGNKYKKCCGMDQSSGSDSLSHPSICDSAQAYSGPLGEQREQFAIRYIADKKNALKEIEAGLEEKVQADNLVISCRKGCSHCCSNYPEATLQECESVVYHLYNHENILKAFLINYPGWRKKVESLEADYRNIASLTEQFQSNADDVVKMQLDAARAAYHQHRASCPFLVDGACSIHEVRPWVCASIVSVTPGEWCDIENSDYSEVLQYTSDLWLSKEVKFFLPTATEFMAAPMPAAVYRILKDGYKAWKTFGVG